MQVSVIIPTKNNIDILVESLRKIVELKVDNMEIIVVNDGDIFELPKEIQQKIIFLNNQGRGVSFARNYAAHCAKGEVLFFIDDDMWVNQKAINEIYQLHRNNLVQKNVYVLNWIYPDSLINELKKVKLGRYILQANYHSAIGRMHIKAPKENIIPVEGIGSGSMVISKEIFSKIGGYNSDISFQGEDIDLSNRLLKNEISIFFNANVSLEHNQSHRMHMIPYLERLNKGYESEISAFKNGFITNKYQYRKSTKYYFYILVIPFEKRILGLLNLLPNKIILDKLSFKLINVLSGIQFYKNLQIYFNRLNQEPFKSQ
jgi:glycosyltransferase involved in cell wall biosynthesis